MASEWSKVRIEDIAEKIAMGPFGSNIKVETFVDDGIPVISGAHLHGARVEDGNFNFITEDHAERLKNSNVFRGDIIFTHAGNIGQVAYIPHNSQYERYVISQRQFYLRCKTDIADPAFITYFFHSDEGQHKLLANASQTGVPSIARPSSYLKTIELLLPPLTEQRAIAHILGTLDDKIELNRKQNETLEAMARALFKAWFVDFEPVRAKMEGRWQRGQSLPGLPAHLYDLFPDRLVESELGEIPEGWRYGFLSDVATFQNGYAFKSKDWQESGGHPVVKIGNVRPGFIDISGASHVSHESVIGLDRFRLNRGDLLIGMTGYVGETGLVPAIEPSAYLNQRVGRISTKQGLADLGFMYCIVRRKEYKSYAELKSRGSAQANVSSSDLMSYSCVLPTSEMLDRFNEVLNPIIEMILENHDENQTLVQLRDTFLPKLISGELRVPDAEAFLGDHEP